MFSRSLFAPLSSPLDVKKKEGLFQDDIPLSVVSLVTAGAGGQLRTIRGPAAETYYAGDVADGWGGVIEDGDGVPIHPLDDLSGYKGVLGGGAYTNAMPAGSENFTTGWTFRGISAPTQNADGSWRVTLGSRGTMDMYINSVTGVNPHVNSLTVRLVSGDPNIRVGDPAGWSGGIYSINSTTFIKVANVVSATGTGMLLSAASGYTTTVDLKFPMIVNNTAYTTHAYIPPQQTSVSAAGSSTGNGIQIPLDVGSRIRSCFTGFQQFMPVPEPSSLTDWATKSGVTVEAASGDMASLFDYVTRIPESAVQVYAYQSYTTDIGPCTLSFYAMMDDESAPVIASSTSDNAGDFAFKVGSNFIYTGVVERVGSTNMYRVCCTDTGIESLWQIGIVRQAAFSGKGFVCAGFNLTKTTTLQSYWSGVGYSPQATDATIATLCYMGASSAEITSTQNIWSVTDTAAAGLYISSGGNVNFTDGTNTHTVTTSWSAGDFLLCVPEIDAENSLARLTVAVVDTDFVKQSESSSAWGAFDGSLSPGTHEREFYGNTAPICLNQRQIWGKLADVDTEIMPLIRRYQSVPQV